MKIRLTDTLIKNTGLYTFSNLLNTGIPFLILPILTRHLTPEDYGLISMFALLISFTTPLIGLSLNGSIIREYYNQENVDIKEYIYNCIVVIAMSTVLTSIVFMVFGEVIARVASFPKQLLWTVILFSASLSINNIFLSLMQAEKKPFHYALYKNLNTLLNVVLSLVLIFMLELGWKGRVFGQLIAIVIFAGIGILYLYKLKWIRKKYNFEYIKQALIFGLPLLPHSISTSIITMTDRLFITNMIGLSATGIYTVGYQVGSIINILAASFNLAYLPWLFGKLKENNNNTNSKIVKFTYIYFIFMFSLSILLGIISPLLLKVFLGTSFVQASIYVIWISLGYSFNAMYSVMVNFIYFERKNGYLSWATFGAALLNIVLNYFFIRRYGAIGAAQATTIIYFTKFILIWLIAKRIHPMPWKQVMISIFKLN